MVRSGELPEEFRDQLDKADPGKEDTQEKALGKLAGDISSEEENDEPEGLPCEAILASKKSGSGFGRYIKIERLGFGGSGSVYKAFDTVLQRFVAVKILESSIETSLERFRHEAKIVAGLKHPNIAPIFDFGEIDGKHYISMQLIEGRTLNKFKGEIDHHELAEIIKKVCGALKYAHSKDIIHRDIKPHNIIIDKEQRVYLLDFGIARQTGSELTQTGGLVGTPEYMAPEQLSGRKADQRTDIYSLGITFYQCLTGVNPFEGGSPAEVVTRVISNDAPPVSRYAPGVPEPLDQIIHQCIGKDPSQRFGSCNELIYALELFQSGEPARSMGITKRNSFRRLLSLFAFVILFTAVIATYSLLNNHGNGNMNEVKNYYMKGLDLLKAAKKTRLQHLRAKVPELLEGAISSLDMAIAIGPDYHDAYMARGEAYEIMGLYPEAIKDYSLVISKGDREADARLRRMISIFYYMYMKASFHLHELSMIYYHLNRLLTPDDWKRFRDVLFEDIDYCKKSKEEWIRLFSNGIDSLIEKDYHKASRNFELSIEQNPAFADSYILFAAVGFKESMDAKGKVEKSEMEKFLQSIEIAMGISPNRLRLYEIALPVIMGSGREDVEILSFLELQRTIDPYHVNFFFAEAVIYMKDSDTDKLGRLLEQIADLATIFESHNDIRYLDRYLLLHLARARIYLFLGEKDKVVEICEYVRKMSFEHDQPIYGNLAEELLKQ